MKFFDALKRTSQTTLSNVCNIACVCDESAVNLFYLIACPVVFPIHLSYTTYLGIHEALNFPSYKGYNEDETLKYLERIQGRSPRKIEKFFNDIKIKYHELKNNTYNQRDYNYLGDDSKNLLAVLNSNETANIKFNAIKYYLTRTVCGGLVNDNKPLFKIIVNEIDLIKNLSSEGEMKCKMFKQLTCDDTKHDYRDVVLKLGN